MENRETDPSKEFINLQNSRAYDIEGFKTYVRSTMSTTSSVYIPNESRRASMENDRDASSASTVVGNSQRTSTEIKEVSDMEKGVHTTGKLTIAQRVKHFTWGACIPFPSGGIE